MTAADVEAKSAALEAIRLGYERDHIAEVGKKVADAQAHALKALTDTLKATKDGRPSILAINRSPSYQAAQDRLNELWTWLAGPGETSLEGKIRDARDGLYIEAARLWFPLIPANLRSRSTAMPPEYQRKAIRATPIHGYDVRKYLEGPILTARRTLKASLEQASRRSTPGHVEIDLLATWERRTREAVSRAVKTLLNDSTEYADRMAGLDLIKGEYIESSKMEDG